MNVVNLYFIRIVKTKKKIFNAFSILEVLNAVPSHMTLP